FEVLSNAEQYAPLQKKAKPLMAFAAMMTGLMDASAVTPLDELLNELVEVTGYRAMLVAEGLQGQTRLENIEELKTTIKRYESETEEPTLGGFLEEVALYTDLDSYDTDADAVTLMTLHAAKGLEFPLVFIPGVEEGIFPSIRSLSDPEQLEEERRLAYVGITRAKQHLTLLTAGRRMLFGQTLYGRESRFLREIPAALLDRQGRKQKITVSESGAAAGKPQQKVGIGAAKAAPAPFSLAVGDRVSHRVFGDGLVVAVSPMGGDHLVEINFDKVGVKKIMAAYARLTKLES
ncbi:MAG: 3'-5' exonuclease, partial [Oscillospiraceae bacterium]